MKATGIVRRIDDLGRVVIPKEIRRTMRIREGDPLEIYTTKDGEVIFKKYSLLGGLEDFAAQFCDTLSRSTEFTAAVTDRDAIIAVAGVLCTGSFCHSNRKGPTWIRTGAYLIHVGPFAISGSRFLCSALTLPIRRAGVTRRSGSDTGALCWQGNRCDQPRPPYGPELHDLR